MTSLKAKHASLVNIKTLIKAANDKAIILSLKLQNTYILLGRLLKSTYAL